MGSQRRLILVAGALSLATLMPMGYSNAYPNTAFETFKSFFNESMVNRRTEMDSSTFTWIWSAYLNVWFPGFLVGTLVAPKITDHFGRKKALALSNVLCLVATVISLLSLPFMCPELLIVGRIASAIASSIGMSSLILFLQEVAPTAIRGRISSYPAFCLTLTTLLGIICGLPVVLGENLFVLIGLPVIPSLCALLFLAPCPETPKFLLINRKDKDKANKSIVFFQGKDINIEKVLEAISAESQDEVGSQKTSLGEIWRTPYLRQALLIGTVALLLQVSTGIQPIVFLSNEFFIRAGLSKFAAEIGTVAMMVLMAIATFISMQLVDRCGRRPLILGCGAASVACLVAFTVFEVLQKTLPWASYGCLVALLAFSVTFSLGLGSVPWFIAAEMAPQRHRALIQSVALTVRSLVASSVGFVTLPMYDAINSLSFIPLLIIPSIIFLVFLYKKMPETKGQEVHTTVTKLSMITQTPTAVSKLEVKF
uniref:Major facilitator superfamily (MFS) profile domain-containing protein n=1 Tax=Plectus sambesii TaxID=2011161 RepID=A0A914XF83_9BILA